MIKSLLEPEANQPDEIKPEAEQTTGESAFKTVAAPPYVEVNEAEDLLETSEKSDAPAVSEKPKFGGAEQIESLAETTAETINLAEPNFNLSAETFGETSNETTNFFEKNFGQAETFAPETKDETIDFKLPAKAVNEAPNFIFPSETTNQATENKETNVFFQSPAEPESFAETARKSGLAYAAAITLFASVVFMLVIGWFADLLFDSSPWGKVGGIVLGSLIGFIQLFRITSQIFKNKD